MVPCWPIVRNVCSVYGVHIHRKTSLYASRMTVHAQEHNVIMIVVLLVLDVHVWLAVYSGSQYNVILSL